MLYGVGKIPAGRDGVMHNTPGRQQKARALAGWRGPQMPVHCRPEYRKIHMSEVSQAPKAKAKAGTPAASMFEFPKFEMPSFEMPHMEVPAAFRELAEKSVSQAKDTYERMKSAAEEATDVLEDTYATATKG